MGQVLHGSARTTEAVRRAIQHSQESLRVLAQRHGINQKTVAKWKNRTSATDLPTGPKKPRSTVLSVDDEAIIVAFRRHTLLPLDDCLYALQPTIPHLTRSSLHRCLARHGISRLPEVEGDNRLGSASHCALLRAWMRGLAPLARGSGPVVKDRGWYGWTAAGLGCDRRPNRRPRLADRECLRRSYFWPSELG
jgi:hypothetical protein